MAGKVSETHRIEFVILKVAVANMKRQSNI